MEQTFFLPGTDKQLRTFLEHVNPSGLTALIIGAGSEEIAKTFASSGASEIFLIVEDNDSLMNSRLELRESPDIKTRLMDFDNTDFPESKFDIIYAQASLSNSRRNKIVKELSRILKPGGVLCVGENTSLSLSPPKFVKDIWESSDITPLNAGSAAEYYTGRKFELILESDLSGTLKEFYSMSSTLLKSGSDRLSDEEKSYHKKFIKKISHESNAYLKLGGAAHMGFKMLILRKASA